MLRHNGNHIGDSWYFVKDGVCHCFYLTCPETVERHMAWDIAHAVSRDLTHWEKQGIALRKGGEDSWDCRCLSTGSVIEFQGKYWMAYTGQWNSSLGKIGLAVSNDLFHWEKAAYNPILTPEGSIFSVRGRGLRKFSHWRDPKLLRRGDEVFGLICATSKTAPGDACGAVAVCRSKDMVQWDIAGELEIEPVCQELECPQIYKIEGRYFLIFSCFYDLFSEKMKRKYGGRLRQTSYYMTADSFWGPYRFIPDFDILPSTCEDDCQNAQYANQLIPWNGKWYITGTVWSDKGDYIADCREVRINKKEEIIYAGNA